jgi:hypothetical protein
VLVAGFEAMVHRLGATTAMARKAFLFQSQGKVLNGDQNRGISRQGVRRHPPPVRNDLKKAYEISHLTSHRDL